MKSLQAHLTEYIAARRALGTQLQEPAQTLRGFIAFLGRKKAKFIIVHIPPVLPKDTAPRPGCKPKMQPHIGICFLTPRA